MVMTTMMTIVKKVRAFPSTSHNTRIAHLVLTSPVIHHERRSHHHGPGCGHTGIVHEGHIDYLHDGHLHHVKGGKVEEHALAVNNTNPADRTPKHACTGHDKTHKHCPNFGHPAVPHGDYVDYLVDGHLHHPDGDHCDDHGPVKKA
jgi:hypothetical protein